MTTFRKGMHRAQDQEEYKDVTSVSFCLSHTLKLHIKYGNYQVVRVEQ